MLGIVVIGIIALLIVFANWQYATKQHNRLVTIALNGFVALMGCGGTLIIAQVAGVNPGEAPLAATPVRYFLVVWMLGMVSSAAIINLPEARKLLERALNSKLKRMLKRPHPRYDPRSVVHTTALVLGLFYLTYNAYTFATAGGLTGVAEQYTETTSDETGRSQAISMAFDLFLNVGFTLLGVGLFMRRSFSQTMRRLGLRFPHLVDVLAGLLTGIGMYALVYLYIWVRFLTTPPEIIQEQNIAARAISDYPTLGLALFMALKAGIGEEILFRGALQPIFGITLTTILFSAVHLQYTLTPTSVIIFGVGSGLAWLRWRYSTTAAIIAHTTYNFVPYLLFGV
jgi:membrane protease YdiL (CAAX protease family)